MNERPQRLRRCQLSVPGISEKMLAKAAASGVDHVFCDFEDAVAPSQKDQARKNVINALNTLDWGRTVRCVRINDVRTEWCYEDVIQLVEGAGNNIDTIMLPKALEAGDIRFLDLLLGQMEKSLKLERRIGIEVLIEEVEGLQNVEEIATASDRLECLIFGMGDYSASQGMKVKDIGATEGYPGDMFHYARFRIAMAARAAKLDPVDGPYGRFTDPEGLRREARRALQLGMVGKWAIHPNQIALVTEIFSPDADEIAWARKVEEKFDEAMAAGLGSISVDGRMVDVASIRVVRNILRKADAMGL
ncbi:CoA ester lyase [Sphingobium sp. JS3065]|uniref:HpcH/HpaI aldolase/citrate lyase family protein n=1 Tax=Sphingobium sp. JS3065 TaxID=2970925 RepID=UPI00226485AA|nr:CoA ester lyase [Sphingobium sp. JS3065]UZW53821.1 CoA ester lyase [Sphingobium sp. JS3065]